MAFGPDDNLLWDWVLAAPLAGGQPRPVQVRQIVRDGPGPAVIKDRDGASYIVIE